MKRIASLLALLSLMTLLATTAALAQTVPQGDLDANCQVTSTQNSAFNPDQEAGQTFTAVRSGELTSAQVQVLKSAEQGSGDYVLRIATVDGSGVPTTSVLASATIPNSSVPNGEQTITANFPLASAAQVVEGQKYALLVHRSNTLFTLAYREDNPCSGGSLYWSTGGSPFWQLDGNRDLVFATYVTPHPPNDNFADSRALKGGKTTADGTTAAATTEIGEPQHGEHSVWYSWKAPASGKTTVNTCTASIDSILTVYTGGRLDALRQVAGKDDGCSNEGKGSKVAFRAREGKTYRIAVGDVAGGQENSFTLKVRGARQ